MFIVRVTKRTIKDYVRRLEDSKKCNFKLVLTDEDVVKEDLHNFEKPLVEKGIPIEDIKRIRKEFMNWGDVEVWVSMSHPKTVGDVKITIEVKVLGETVFVFKTLYSNLEKNRYILENYLESVEKKSSKLVKEYVKAMLDYFLFSG